MFSQNKDTTKMAWLADANQPKPTSEQQNKLANRNLFDLRSKPSQPPPTAPVERQISRDPLAENLLQARTTTTTTTTSANRKQLNREKRASSSSFVTSASESISDGYDDDEEEDDDQAEVGSSSRLQRRSFGQLSPKAQALASSSQLIGNGRRANTGSQQQQQQQQQQPTALERAYKLARLATIGMGLLAALTLLVYFWPIDSRLSFEPRVAPARPRPHFEGPLAINSQLDELGERLFQDQFHGAESMAWTADKRAFFTGVEGGFILFVEPYAQRWTLAARLNAPDAIEDQTGRVQGSFQPETSPTTSPATNPSEQDEANHDNQTTSGEAKQRKFAPFCSKDVLRYGPRAEFEPSLVVLSQCSRPLGIRLAPDGSRLYVADPLSGLYRVELARDWLRALGDSSRPVWSQNQVVKLIDFAAGAEAGQEIDELRSRPTRDEEVLFGDDIAVDFDREPSSGGGDGKLKDVVYLTDCSRRWSLRFLFWLMLENDDTGRVLRFELANRRLSQVVGVTPVELALEKPTNDDEQQISWPDQRGLSFPNGIELTADKSALLISDLNNRRILKYHLRGSRKGTSELVMFVPGYSDNIRRGLDLPDGTPTYWFACGCAVSDGKYEIAETFNEYPAIKRLLLRWLHLFGTTLNQLGHLFSSTQVADAGAMLDAAWLKRDPYCTHGVVAQFTERGQVLRSLHGLGFSSNYRLLSEAHEVPRLDSETDQNNNRSLAPGSSTLYLGSVYYSFLGRVQLEQPAV